MRNDLAVEKMIQMIEKIQRYCADMDYKGINLKVIWEVIETDLPVLLMDLEKL